NNFTTDYIIEDHNAFSANDYIRFVYDEDISTMKINTGEALDAINFNRLVDGSDSTFIRLNSSGGVLDFTIASNFAGTMYDGPVFNVYFDREIILGLISQVSSSLNNDAYLTLKMYNIQDSTWINVTDRIFFNSSLGIQHFSNVIINENLNYINGSDISQIQFLFQGVASNNFILRLREFELTSTYGFDIPITDSKHVGLEFDLKGKRSTINGFYAWIRTLNTTKALNAELNISLYKANATIVRTQSSLRANNLKPDDALLIDSMIINYNEYHGDDLRYYEFNTANTQDLFLYNYFIVIKSNSTDEIYSLVTLPRQEYGDPDNRVDHKLITSVDSGTTWNIAKKQLPSIPLYTSQQLDAAAFKLNVTRAYKPSDFTNPYDSQDTLRIQDIPITDSTSSSLIWGEGYWINNFTTDIVNDGSFNFPVDLTWNNSIIQGFEFNVSYTVKAYWIENAISYYNVSYDTSPEWQLNFTLNLADPNLNDWDFQEFWFTYPTDYYAHNLTNPNYNDIYRDILNKTGGEHDLVSKPSYSYTSVPTYIVNGISGQYSLALNSSNLVHDTHSYINYNGKLWETNGFMYGDNISIQLDIKAPGGTPPSSGNANAILFYPNNSTKYPVPERNSATGVIEGNYLVYDFDNQTILDVTQATPLLGNYYIGFFWENGSAIGCQKLKLYIDTYDVDMYNLFYDTTFNQNILVGTIDDVYEEYSILIGTVNVTNDRYYPDFYAVNLSDINQQFIHEISGEEIPILVETFLQNETILNPNEDIRIGTRISNLHGFLELDMKVKVQLVSLANEEWILAEQTTGIQTLKPSIDPNDEDTADFFVDLTIPTLFGNGIWQGVNAPIRKGGVKTRFTVYLDYSGESHEIDTFESTEYALIINSTQSEFEGYIIALKYNTKVVGSPLIKPFERDECMYRPNQTTFVVNIYDKNYVSSYEQFINSFSLNVNSKFSEIDITPGEPIYGQTFNISSVLSTEFGKVFSGKNVTLQYFDNDLWENFSSQITDINGTTIFEIDSLLLASQDSYTFRLTWSGDEFTLANSQNVTVSMYRAFNNISLLITKNVDQLYKNSQSTIQITLNNIGDSELNVLIPNISILISPSISFTIVQIDYALLTEFKPGDTSDIIIKINIPNIDQMSISVSIEARNELTQEELTFQETAVFDIYDAIFNDLIIGFFTFIMIGIFLLVWAVVVMYIRRTIKKIETPFEEPTKAKPRRGRYVSVSELPSEKKEDIEEEPQEKEPKKLKKKKSKKQKVEEEEKATTDLDSLLEEKGLKD
ncbi:MAG: hypothetical protein ACFE96_09165, partial [Candidatus Hermodarchaeota archaeon]